MLSDHPRAFLPTTSPVLIVEDSAAQRAHLVRLLKGWDYDVLQARDGAEALDIVEACDVDLVVCDWMMPGTDGLSFCHAYRALKAAAPGYVLLLTAKSDPGRVAEGLEAGADDFLSKPLNPIELRARLQAGQRIVAAQKEVASKNDLLRNALEELTRTHRGIERDLDEARKLQTAMLPMSPMKIEGADLAFEVRQSGKVGGDLVGAFRVAPGRVGLFGIDVAGHGVASAFLLARVASLFRSGDVEQNLALGRLPDGRVVMRPPDQVCARLNQLLTQEGGDRYLTMILVDLDLASGALTICQAGYPSPMVQRAAGDVIFPGKPSMPIGLLETAEYETYSLRLGSGDRVLIFSDGVTEARDRAGHQLEEAGLQAIAFAHARDRGPTFLEAVIRNLSERSPVAAFEDDVSLALLELA